MVVSYEIPNYFRALNAKQLFQVRNILCHAGYYLPLPQVGDRLYYDTIAWEVYQDDEKHKTLILRTVTQNVIEIFNDVNVKNVIEYLNGYIKYYSSRLNWSDSVTLILHGTEKQSPFRYTGLTDEFCLWLTEYIATSNKSNVIRYTVELVSSYRGILNSQDELSYLYDENKIQWTSDKPYRFYPISDEIDTIDTTDHIIVRDLLTRLFFIEDTAFVVVDETNVTRDYHDVRTLKTLQDTTLLLYSVQPIELIHGSMIDIIKDAIIESYSNKLSSCDSIHEKNFSVGLSTINAVDSAMFYGANILESYSYELLHYKDSYSDIDAYHLQIRLFGPDLLLIELLS